MEIQRTKVVRLPGIGRGRLLVILDRHAAPASRVALVEMLPRWRYKPLITFATGVVARAVQATTEGLSYDIYNAGGGEVVPMGALHDWLAWEEVWLLEGGIWMELGTRNQVARNQ